MNSKLYWYFSPNTETDVSTVVHTFQEKRKNSLEAVCFTCYGKLFKYFGDLLMLQCMKPVKQELFLQCTASRNTSFHQAAF